MATIALSDPEGGAVDDIVGIVLGFALTTIAGGWWAARLQDRSWARQNELRLREAERERAAAACRDVTSLLDRRLYRMLRLLYATRTVRTTSSTPRNSRVGEATTTRFCMPGTTA